jgi:hypothetical protein
MLNAGAIDIWDACDLILEAVAVAVALCKVPAVM